MELKQNEVYRMYINNGPLEQILYVGYNGILNKHIGIFRISSKILACCFDKHELGSLMTKDIKVLELKGAEGTYAKKLLEKVGLWDKR
jgi:hypothetical protein